MLLNMQIAILRNASKLLLLSGLLGLAPCGAYAEAGNAAQLKAHYASLNNELRNSPFNRPLIIDSKEDSDSATGEVYAVINYPFSKVSNALKDPANWCDIMILHQNTKYCKASGDLNDAQLKMLIGKKVSQELDEAHQMDLNYRLIRSDANFMAVQLDADQGPLDTKNYKVLLEAVPVNSKQTFLHFSYSYAYGLAGRIAIKAYLASAGRNKVGFSPSDEGSGFIGGVRGMVERNTMRYYLAIDSYLGALSAPPDRRLIKRLQDWYAATERYPRQLREISRNAYLSMKREEIRRMETM